MVTLGNRNSMGCGDRFTNNMDAIIGAFLQARQMGILLTPGTNISDRELRLAKHGALATMQAIDAAVQARGLAKGWLIFDADHIRAANVTQYMDAGAEFYTLDVANALTEPSSPSEIDDALREEKVASLVDANVHLPGIEGRIPREGVRQRVGKYLRAVNQAKSTYGMIEGKRGRGNSTFEVSMDETEDPHNPLDMLVILALAADARIPIESIAPKFTGIFNKGVDYVGDTSVLDKELAGDIAVIQYAKKALGMSPALRLSVHSGSDKWSVYPGLRAALIRASTPKDRAFVHLKTAGTTYLQELRGLCEGTGYGLVQELYRLAHESAQLEVTNPSSLFNEYTHVVKSVNRAELPSPEVVKEMSAMDFVDALAHNASMRQMMHCSFSLASGYNHMAEGMREPFLAALADNRNRIHANVTDNLLAHMRAAFPTEFDYEKTGLRCTVR